MLTTTVNPDRISSMLGSGDVDQVSQAIDHITTSKLNPKELLDGLKTAFRKFFDSHLREFIFNKLMQAGEEGVQCLLSELKPDAPQKIDLYIIASFASAEFKNPAVAHKVPSKSIPAIKRAAAAYVALEDQALSDCALETLNNISNAAKINFD